MTASLRWDPNYRAGPMDAPGYFELTDAIGAVETRAALEALRTRIRATEMHAFERDVLERVLRSRAEALRRLRRLAHAGA